MKQPFFSVYIIVYNGESYISRSIESVLRQTFTDFELVVVDDGSTDSTADIIHKYIRDPRVKLIMNGKNGGVSFSRNVALENIGGKYLLSCDSDDEFIRDDAFEIIYDLCTDNPDLLCFSAQGYRGLERSPGEDVILADSFLDAKDADFHNLALLNLVSGVYGYGVWNKCINLSVIKRQSIVFYQGITVGEDIVFLSECLTNSLRIRCSSQNLYRVEQRNGSVSRHSKGILYQKRQELIQVKCMLSNSLKYPFASDAFVLTSLFLFKKHFVTFVQKDLRVILRVIKEDLNHFESHLLRKKGMACGFYSFKDRLFCFCCFSPFWKVFTLQPLSFFLGCFRRKI